MRFLLMSTLLIFAVHGASSAQTQRKATVCPKEKPAKSAVVYSASYTDGSTASGRIFICSTTPINTEALWLETEAHIKGRKDMAGAKSVQITNILDLRR